MPANVAGFAVIADRATGDVIIPSNDGLILRFDPDTETLTTDLPRHPVIAMRPSPLAGNTLHGAVTMRDRTPIIPARGEIHRQTLPCESI